MTEQIIAREYQEGGTAQGWHGQDQSWTYALPFSFNFYGTTYNSLRVNAKGYVCFDENSTCTGDTDFLIRTNNEPMIVVAGGETNRTDYTGENDIYITENSDNVVIRWNTYNYGPMDNINFELVLYNNGSFAMNYGDDVTDWESFAVGASSGSGTYTRSIYYNKEDLGGANSVLWGDLPSNGGGGGGSGTVNTKNLSLTVSENLTLNCGSSIDLDNGTLLTAGTPQTNTTTCHVTTNDQDGYTLSLTNDRGTNNTLYHTTNSSTQDGQIQDKAPWNSTAPNATNWSGTGLGFGILSSTATKNTTWWGNANNCNDTTQLYAGIPQTDTLIMQHDTYSNTQTDTTICYKLDIPSTQLSGEYTGSVTYTAVGRP